MSINSLFEISQRSFRALNSKMNATGQNIANSDSEGYHRRRATLQANNTVSPGLYTSPAQNNTPGDGASMASFERVRNRMLDQAAAEAQTGESGAREEARILSRLEGALATDTEGSLTSSLESFFGGLNDLANNPTDQGVRETVLAKADSLTSEFDRLDQQIGDLVRDTESALSDSVDAANRLIKEVASLNEKISEARASGTPDLAAKDRRDAAVKELSELIPVDAQENAENGYTLSVDGMNVVQGTETTLLQARSSPRKSSKQFPVEVTDTGLDLNTDQGKEDAATIGPGDFGPGEGADNLDQNLVEGDVGGQAGVEAPIKGQLDGNLQGGTFDITVEDGDGADELDFTVEDGSGTVVTGGAQTVDVSTGGDITLEQGIAGDVKLDVSDGAGNGFEAGDVTGSDEKEFSVSVTDTSLDLNTDQGKEDAVTINEGDFAGSNEGADNLDENLVEGDVGGQVGVEAPIKGQLDGNLQGGNFDITVEDGDEADELDFIVEDESGNVVTGGAQTIDLSSGQNDLNSGDSDIILEEGSGGTGNIELDVLDIEGFAPDDVIASKIQKSTVEFGDTGVAFEPGDEDAGELGAQLRTLNETLPEVQNQLDTLAEDVVAEVNAIHETGFDQNGFDGNSFFDPAGTTAGSIKKTVDVPEKIAAYGAAGEPGDTTPAQDMADLSDSLTPKAIDLAANVGSKVQQAAAREEAKAANAENLESLAQGISDVSVDEEMSNLIEQQQQFAASARVLRTAQEVTNTLLSM